MFSIRRQSIPRIYKDKKLISVISWQGDSMRTVSIMITRLVVAVLTCSSYLLVIQILLPQTIALRIAPNVDEFMIENQRTRTRTRQNYVIQRALDEEMGIDNLAKEPPAEAFESDATEDLTDQIVDYANMIRDDIIFLDNSVETTTRKRGNIKKKNHAIPDVPCSCESEIQNIRLGSDYFPRELDSLRCMKDTCPVPYRCKPIYYYVTVLKRKMFPPLRSKKDAALPNDLHRWMAHKINVTTSCICSRDYFELN